MADFESSKNGNDHALCANNCGFYGNPNNRNLCSVCYAAFLKETGAKYFERQKSSKSQINLETRQSSYFGVSENLETCDHNDPAPPKTQNRCEICQKKVGMIGFSCQCGGCFCGKHRYPEEHSCGFDHKEVGRKILAKQMVERKADKLEFRI
ncbi:zinc finger A20 and AN1 domain-containing stress-associated protein 10-like [Cucumis sativus]|uniref:Zinc finger protein n=1 Tax=Cucumis sativus TaxID=3659 RepID=A0A0A0LB47_CUCSA|nr:zinc finger A20 and AN1 domain-containing stress-associated protein 10-like [Cucumis sativus]